MRIEFNDEELQAEFRKLDAMLSDFRPVFEVLGDLLEDTTQKRFDQGVSPEGTPWAPKSQTTIDNYKRRGLTVNFKPLFGPNEDGLPLRRSFFHTATATSLELGTNKIQAAVMQFGASKGQFGTYEGKGFGGSTPTISIPWGDIPARPFLGISVEDRGLISETIEEWLDDAVED